MAEPEKTLSKIVIKIQPPVEKKVAAIEEFLDGKTRLSNRHWFFTSYSRDCDGLKIPEIPETKIRYMIYQEEICPSTGRHHLQGYLELYKQTASRRNIQNWLGLGNIHLEMVRDTGAAIAYCQKTKTAVAGTQREFGERKVQGSNQGNVVTIQDIVLRGGSQLDCYKAVGSAQFTNGADRVRLATMHSIAKGSLPAVREFLNEHRIKKACKLRWADSIYYCDKFTRHITHNYAGENVLVVLKTEDWFSGELRGECEWRPVWLPRKGLSDIPLIASEIWYPLFSGDTGEQEAMLVLKWIEEVFDYKARLESCIIEEYLYGPRPDVEKKVTFKLLGDDDVIDD